MNQCEELLKLLMEAIRQDEQKREKTKMDGSIPVGVSNRHVHLSQADLDQLFGPGYNLTNIKDLSQSSDHSLQYHSSPSV